VASIACYSFSNSFLLAPIDLRAGNMEGAKIYAQNAIRKKSESINYLQLASRLDAVVARLDQQSKMGQVNKNMVGIVNSLGRALKNAPLDRMVAVSFVKPSVMPSVPYDAHSLALILLQTMNTFEKQFENLDVQTGVMNDAMNQQAALATPPEQVNMLLQQIADENGLEVRLGLPQASIAAVPATAQKEEDGTLASRLAGLRGAK
jgi:charged multivesicular body protein 1